MSEDRTFESLSPLNTADEAFAMELEGTLQESYTVEAQDYRNGLNHNKKKLTPRRMIGESTGANSRVNKQRKRQGPNELSKAKRRCTKKGRPTFDFGESSEASQRPEPKSIEQLLENKSVLQALKIFRDRVHRRIRNDKLQDKESCIYLMTSVMKNQLSDLYSPIVQSLDKIKKQWPPRSDLADIMKMIKQMEDEERGKESQAMEVTVDMKKRLKEIEEKIKTSDKTRLNDSAKVNELEEIFTTEGVSVETQREGLSSAFPWLVWEANNEPAANEVQASLQTCKQLTVMDMEKLEKFEELEELEKKIFDEDNQRVGFSDFQGLEDSVKAAQGNIPDYLKSIAKRIQDDRNETTSDALRNILVLVSAAVKEMEDLAEDEPELRTLFKWGATFNLAKHMGFEVKRFENLLKKNVHAYLYSRLKAG